MPQNTEVEYGQLFNALPQSYLLIAVDDPTFTLVAENQAHADIAMMPFNQAIGKPFLEAYPDRSLKFKKTGVSDIVESLRKVARTGEPDVMEDLRYDLKRPDGKLERRYWRATHYPVLGDDGKVRLILQNSVNVTREVLAGRKLEEAQRQLDEALAIGLIGTWLWDLSEDYVVADKNLLRLFGIKPEDAKDGLPLRQFTDSIHPDDRSRITGIIQQTVADKRSFEEEYRTVTKEGETRWVIARGRVEIDEAGKAVRFPGVIVDISERKLAEQNLRYLTQVSTMLGSTLDYGKILESIARLAVPELADWCTIDLVRDGKIKMVGLAHRDPEKVKWAKALRQKQLVSMDDKHGVAQVLRTGKSEYFPAIDNSALAELVDDPEHLRIVRELNLSSAMVVPLVVDGQAVGAMTFVSAELKRHYSEDDLRMAEEVANRAAQAITNANLFQTAQEEIRARAALEEQLRQANEQLEARVEKRTAQLRETNRNLERSNQELQDFAYVASHDLQEPLRKIQAFGNLLEEEFGEHLGEGRDYLDRMRNAAARMSVLIEDLLSFSRVTTKAAPPTNVDLNKVAAGVMDDLEFRVEDCQATVTIGTLPTVLADELQMRQLLQNLIGNALKFNRPGVKPVVAVEAEPFTGENAKMKFWRLTVADNGIGFDEKYLDRIFAVFQRLHGKDVYKGTGIGLAICRKIVERHGGTITATSIPDKGSTFIVTLPDASHQRPNGDTPRAANPKSSERMDYAKH